MRRRLGIAAALWVLASPGSAGAASGPLEFEGPFSYVEAKELRGEDAVRRRQARFPALRRIRAVRRYLSHRGGINSWSLIDSWGRPHGFEPHRVYVSASLVKAMLLTAYLRGIGSRMPDASERSLLGPMITVSSNDAADSIYYRVGDPALYGIARRAHMTRFSVAGYWGNAHFSAQDQARLFRRIDRLIPAKSRAYARRLLSSIVSYQRWGFSRYAAAAGFKSFLKGGWRETAAGRLVHEAALFERGGRRISMAVLTDGNPSHDYGTETLRGVAKRIFRRRPRRAVSPSMRGWTAIIDPWRSPPNCCEWRSRRSTPQSATSAATRARSPTTSRAPVTKAPRSLSSRS